MLASESSTRLLEHSPKYPENPSESLPKLPEHYPKYSPKYPENPSESSPKLLEHSQKHPENPPESLPKLPEHSQKFTENPAESSPKLSKHERYRKFSRILRAHYIVYPFQYFKLRNYMSHMLSQNFTTYTYTSTIIYFLPPDHILLFSPPLYNTNPTNSARLQGTPCKLTLNPLQGHQSCPTNSAILQGTPTASLRSYPFQGHRTGPPSYTLPT